VGLPSSVWKRLPFREGTKGPQMAHFAAVRMVAERDDLPGPELWLMDRGLGCHLPYAPGPIRHQSRMRRTAGGS